MIRFLHFVVCPLLVLRYFIQLSNICACLIRYPWVCPFSTNARSACRLTAGNDGIAIEAAVLVSFGDARPVPAVDHIPIGGALRQVGDGDASVNGGLFAARACLKIGAVSSSEGFWAAGKQFFSQESWRISRKNCAVQGTKDPPVGHVDMFQTSPRANIAGVLEI